MLRTSHAPRSKRGSTPDTTTPSRRASVTSTRRGSGLESQRRDLNQRPPGHEVTLGGKQDIDDVGIARLTWPSAEHRQPSGRCPRRRRTPGVKPLMLEVGADVVVSVAARKPWNDTGIQVAAGQTYEFLAAGSWVDLPTTSDAAGYP